MGTERWKVNGWSLNDNKVTGVQSRDGLYGTAPISAARSKIAGRHGVKVGRRTLDAGGFSLNLWVSDDTRAGVEAAHERLLQNTVRLDGESLWERTMDDGTLRECYGMVVDSVQPADAGRLVMRLNLAVEVPSGRWRSKSVVGGTSASDQVIPGNGRVELVPWADANAPMDDLSVRLLGPITDPEVVDAKTGRGFKWTGALAAGAHLIVNSETWSLSGATTSFSNLSYDGPTLFELQPGDASGPPAIIVTGSAQSAATRVRVTGRKAYLT